MDVECVSDDSFSVCEATGKFQFVSETNRASEVLSKSKTIHDNSAGNVLNIMLTEWSDGFDMMASAKSNRGSSWIKTVTIGSPKGSYHGLLNTYPIAIGKSGDSHEEVEQLFAGELESLCNGTKKPNPTTVASREMFGYTWSCSPR